MKQRRLSEAYCNSVSFFDIKANKDPNKESSESVVRIFVFIAFFVVKMVW